MPEEYTTYKPEWIDKKDQEISRLQQQAENADIQKKLAVTEAEQKKESEIGKLKLDLEKERNAAEKQVRDLEDGYKREIADRDAVIWRVDMHDLNRNLPQSYRDALQKENAYVFTEASLQGIAPTLADYDRDMDGKAFVTVEPPSVDQRIINQYSFFSVIPPQIGNVEEFLDKATEHTVRYILSKDIRWDVRDLLDQYNVSERIFFPGLDGLSRTLARHYFVK